MNKSAVKAILYIAGAALSSVGLIVCNVFGEKELAKALEEMPKVEE